MNASLLPVLWVLLCLASLGILYVLLSRGRKKPKEEQQEKGYPFRSYCLEFEVTGTLDGTTLVSPAFEPNDLTVDLVTTKVHNLGRINLKPLANQNLYVSWIWLETSTEGEAGAALQVAKGVHRQETIARLEGQKSFYTRQGALITKGCTLRITGFPPGDTPHKVRLTVQYLKEDIKV